MKTIYEIKPTDTSQTEDEVWSINRRKWLKLALSGGIAMQLPWLSSCQPNADSQSQIFDGRGILTDVEFESAYVLLNILFPADGQGPSASDVNAHHYFLWTLEDENLPKDEKNYFLSKLKELLALCKEKFSKNFLDLSKNEQELFVSNNISSGWTRNFFSRLITIGFEALLLDPYYSVNPDEIGWSWLEHIPGTPRPTESTSYLPTLKKIQPHV